VVVWWWPPVVGAGGEGAGLSRTRRIGRDSGLCGTNRPYPPNTPAAHPRASLTARVRAPGATHTARSFQRMPPTQHANFHACILSRLPAPAPTVLNLGGAVHARLLGHKDGRGRAVQERVRLRLVVRLWHRVRELLQVRVRLRRLWLCVHMVMLWLCVRLRQGQGRGKGQGMDRGQGMGLVRIWIRVVRVHTVSASSSRHMPTCAASMHQVSSQASAPWRTTGCGQAPARPTHHVAQVVRA